MSHIYTTDKEWNDLSHSLLMLLIHNQYKNKFQSPTKSENVKTEGSSRYLTNEQKHTTSEI